MNIAELFVTLGIKGSDKTLAALREIEQQLQKISQLPTDIEINLKGGDRTIDSLKDIGTHAKQFTSFFDDAARGADVLDHSLHNVGESLKSVISLMGSARQAAERLRTGGQGGGGAPVPRLGAAQAMGKLIPFPKKDYLPRVSSPSYIDAEVIENKAVSPLRKNALETKKSVKDVLDIKGSEKTVGSLKNVGDSLKSVGSYSFAAKASILATMYAVEQLFAKSGAAGTSLRNFGAAIGMDTKVLQQYQYAARQVGIANEETDATFKSLQQVMTKTSLGQGAPSGLGQVAMLTGGITLGDVNKFMEHPELLLQRLQQYAQKEKRVGIRNEALRSFGLGDNMIAGVARQAFRPEVLQKAPVYSDAAIKGLDQANIMWSNLGDTIQRAIGSLNAAHGGQIVKDFTILVNIGLKLVDILITVAEKIHLFEGIDYLFKKIEDQANGVIQTFMKLGSIIMDFAEKNQVFETLKTHFGELKNTVDMLFPHFIKVGDHFLDIAEKSKAFEKIGRIFLDVVDIVAKLGAALLKIGGVIMDVGDKFKIFQIVATTIGRFLDGFEHVLGGISSVIDKLSSLLEGPKTIENIEKEAMGFINKLPGVFSSFVAQTGSGIFGKADDKEAQSIYSSVATKIPESAVKTEPPAPGAKPTAQVPQLDLSKIGGSGNVIFDPKGFIYAPNLKLVVPTSPIAANASASNWQPRAPAGGGNSNTVQNYNFDQDINVQGGGGDPKQTGDATKKAVQDAFRQLSSQVQGS